MHLTKNEVIERYGRRALIRGGAAFFRSNRTDQSPRVSFANATDAVNQLSGDTPVNANVIRATITRSRNPTR